mgnify:CR=1 FL=1
MSKSIFCGKISCFSGYYKKTKKKVFTFLTEMIRQMRLEGQTKISEEGQAPPDLEGQNI